MNLREAIQGTLDRERTRRLDWIDSELTKRRSPREISTAMGDVVQLCWTEWWERRGPRKPMTKAEWEIWDILGWTDPGVE